MGSGDLEVDRWRQPFPCDTGCRDLRNVVWLVDALACRFRVRLVCLGVVIFNAISRPTSFLLLTYVAQLVYDRVPTINDLLVHSPFFLPPRNSNPSEYGKALAPRHANKRQQTHSQPKPIHFTREREPSSQPFHREGEGVVYHISFLPVEAFQL